MGILDDIEKNRSVRRSRHAEKRLLTAALAQFAMEFCDTAEEQVWFALSIIQIEEGLRP